MSKKVRGKIYVIFQHNFFKTENVILYPGNSSEDFFLNI